MLRGGVSALLDGAEPGRSTDSVGPTGGLDIQESLGTGVPECRESEYSDERRKIFATTSGLEHMSTTDSHAKNRGKKMTAADKKQAQLAANRKARLQWYAVAAVLALAVLITIILITIYTDGELSGVTG